jgi:hypothetical protein
MKNFFLGYFPGILITLLIFSCEEATDWEFKNSQNGALVVDAIITNELKTQVVFLSLSYNELNGEPEPITNAQVLITDGTNSASFFSDPEDPGKYISAIPFAAELNVEYSLEIFWEDEVYFSKSKMTEVQPFAPVTFSPADSLGFMTIRDLPSLYSPFEQAMHEIDIYWFPVNTGDSPDAKLFFYTFTTVDISSIFRPEKERIVFPEQSILIQKKYSLDSAFAAYLRALLMETEWQGGVFDEASASLPTNISNGGLGFFAVCQVLADTLEAE